MPKTIVDHAKLLTVAAVLIGSWIWVCFLSYNLQLVATVLLLIPWYLGTEWLAERVFHPDSILSIKNSPLSLTRILGATVVLTAILLLVIKLN